MGGRPRAQRDSRGRGGHRHENRERSVSRAPGPARTRIGDFPLQHHRGVAESSRVRCQLQQADQDRRRDRVWQVAPLARRVEGEPSTSIVRKSPRTTVRRPSCSSSSESARSRSISTATTRPAREASGRVMAPRPGPISRNVSVVDGATASTTSVPTPARESAGRTAAHSHPPLSCPSSPSSSWYRRPRLLNLLFREPK